MCAGLMFTRRAYDNDKRDPGMLDVEIAQLLNSHTKEEFNGFVEN